MSFRVALASIWFLAASGIFLWLLLGGFGIRISHPYLSWLPIRPGFWLLWVIAGLLSAGCGLIVAYFLAKILHMIAPDFVR